LKSTSKVEQIKQGLADGFLSKTRTGFEKDIILEALNKKQLRPEKAADLLGISRRILKYRMAKYGMAASLGTVRLRQENPEE